MAFEHDSGRSVPVHRTMPDDDVIDLRELWRALVQHKRFILLCGVGLFTLVMGYTLLSPMVFEADARLYLGELATSPSERENPLANTEASDVATEIEILQSRSLVERAVLAAGLNVDLYEPGYEPMDYLAWRRSGRDVEALAETSGRLLAQHVRYSGPEDEPSFDIEFIAESQYRVTEGGKAVGQGTLGTTFKAGGLEMILLPGGTASPVLRSRFILDVYPLEETVDDALMALDVSAPASQGDAIKVVTLSTLHANPYAATRFLRSLMEEYLEERQSWKTENASAAEQFVSQQLRNMRDSLDATQEKLADYRSENRAVVSDSEAEALVAQLGRYEEQRVAAKLEASALASILSAVRDPNAPVEAFMFGEASDSVLQGLAGSLSESRRKLADLQSKFKAAAPDIKQQQASVDAQRDMIKSYVRNRLTRARKNVAELERVIREYEEKLKSVPTAEVGLAQIDRESEVYSKMFSYLLERQQQTAIVKASTISKNRVLDPPRLPTREHSPKLGLRAASLVVGLLLGVFVVVARTLLSPKLTTETDIQRLAAKAPLLASVPSTRNPPKPLKPGMPAPALFDVLANPADTFAFTEGFRALRTSLYEKCPPTHGRVVTITSPAPGDGKTTCTLSLAAILAGDRKRVLVIDGDVRKPSHHTLTMAPASTGLRGLLEGVQHWKDVVHTVHLSVGSFDSVGCAMPARAELLGSPQLTKFLVDARSRYDYILIDAASYPLVADAMLLARQSDLVLSIMRLGATDKRTAEQHLHGLSSSSAPIAWVVNAAEPKSTYAYGYGYGDEAPASKTGHSLMPTDRLQ